MEEWYCFKCKEKMVQADITGQYMDIEATTPGLKCPECGTVFLTEEQCLKVNKDEEVLESKL